MIFCITNAALLQMECRSKSGDTAPCYGVPRAHLAPSGVRPMEIRPNSGPDTPCLPLPTQRTQPGGLPPSCLERERARTYRMLTYWDGPRYPMYSSYISHLRSFAKRSWLHHKRSPVKFSVGGLFYTGTVLCV